MISALVLSVPCWLAPAPSVIPTVLQDGEQADQQDVNELIAACGDDVEKLLALATDLKANGRRKEARPVYTKILELDANNEEAHRGLGHQNYDGQWFNSYSEMSAYRRAEEKRMLEEHGKVRFKDEWVLEVDVPYLRMGWVKDDGGEWTDPARRDRLAQEAKYREQGYQQQDLTWIPPDEFPKWEEGLWKCGEEWLDTDAANTYHEDISQWWEVPGERFVVLSTLDREGVNWAVWYADLVYPQLVRAVGLEPAEKPEIVVLRGLTQYNQFASGDQALGLPPTEATGSSSVHYAYFAEAWLDIRNQPPTFRGCGVAFWDRADPNMAVWGGYAVRHAAAHSYLEAIDPSWDAVSLLIESPQRGFQEPAFWREKKIPRWFRYGTAAYIERFAQDMTVAEGGDPWAVRNWAIDQVRAGGGVRAFADLFGFPMNAADPAAALKLIQEAGVVVAFVVDGNCKPVTEAHEAWKAALRTGDGHVEAAEALQQAIAANEEDFRMFANL